MRLIIISILLIFVSYNIYSKEPVNISMSSGEDIIIPTENQMESDWKADFEDNKTNLIKHQVISDYLDGTEGFSIEEKGFWIVHYNKSPNIKNLIKNDPKYISIYKIYYLQGIFLRAQLFGNKTRISKDLDDKLNELIHKIFPVQVSQKDITTIRITSIRKFLHTQLNLRNYFDILNDANGEKIIANYFLDDTSLNRKLLLDYYSTLLSNVEIKIKELQNFLKSKEELEKTYSKVPEVLKTALTEDETQKREQVSLSIKKSDIFLTILTKLKFKNLLAAEVVRDITNPFILTLKNKFPVTKDFY